MKRRTCPVCGGHGQVFDWFGVLLNPSNWIPFTWPKNAYSRCEACKGRGVIYQEWQIRPTRLTRRRPR